MCFTYHSRCTRHISYRSVSHLSFPDMVRIIQIQVFRISHQLSIFCLYYLSAMCKINVWQFYFFSLYIIPDIQFCPVGNRKSPHIFTFIYSTIIDIPYFRSLFFWIPLTKVVPYRKYPFFCSGLFFIPSCSTYTDIKFKLFNSVKQCVSLKGISARKFTRRVYQFSFSDGIFYFSYDQFFVYFFHQLIPKVQCFRKIVSGIYVYQRKWKFTWHKGFLCQMNQTNAVLASTE